MFEGLPVIIRFVCYILLLGQRNDDKTKQLK